MKEYKKTRETLLKNNKKAKLWQKIVTAMCSVAVFCTVYALVLPAITISNDHLDDLDQINEVIDEYANNIPDELPETKNERVTLVAKNQLNTNIENNIYIDWFNNQYEDISVNNNIAFINYVLNYSKVDNDLPNESNALDLLMSISESDLSEGIYTLEDHKPEKGDLVFLWDTERLDDLNEIEDELEYENAYKNLYSVGVIINVDIENNNIDYVTGEDNDEHLVSLCSIETDSFEIASFFSSSSFNVLVDEIDETVEDNTEEEIEYIGELKIDGTPFEAFADKSDTKPKNNFGVMMLTEEVPPMNANKYVQEATLKWCAQGSDTWVDLSTDNNMPANAQLLIKIDYDGVNPSALKAANYRMEYTPDAVLGNVECNAPIVSKDGSTIGVVNTENGKLVLTFYPEWVDGLVNSNIGSNSIKSVTGSFEYQAKLDMSKIDDDIENLELNLGGANISLPLDGDNHARYGDLTIQKEVVDNRIKHDELGYYLEYQVTVTSGNISMPDVKVVDTLGDISRFKKVNDSISPYPNVTGVSLGIENNPFFTITSKTNEVANSNTSGNIYLTNYIYIYIYIDNTLTKNDNYAVAAGTNAKDNSSLVWDLGTVPANTTETLKYRVYINDSYIGIYHNAQETLSNNVELSSKGYPHGDDDVTYKPKVDADLIKNNTTGGQGYRTVTNEGKTMYYVDFVVEVAAKDNEYNLTNVKFVDTLDRIPADYRQYVKYVEDSIKVYSNENLTDENIISSDQLTTYLPSNKTNNPNISNSGDNRNFELYLGDLQANEKRYVKYTVEIDVDEAQLKHNGTVGVYNQARLYNDETKVLPNSNPYKVSSRDIGISSQVWDRKISGGQIRQEVFHDLTGLTDVYDATIPEKDSNNMLKKVENPGAFTIPTGAYEYKVVVNEKGEWNVSSALMQDSIGNSSDNQRHLEFVDYVKIDVYDRVEGSNDLGTLEQNLANREIKKTVWVKIDKQWSFSFSGKEIGLTDSDAYVLTYYAKAKGEGFGIATVNNSFNLSGSVGIGGGTYTLPSNAANVTVSTSVKEPGVNPPKKVAWYYDAQDETFAKYHNGNSNGALYWIIKITGDKVPYNMQFQESTRLGSYNNYLRNDESLLGFYAIDFGNAANIQDNADEFIDRYPTYDEFARDLELGLISQVPTDSYTSRWSGYTDTRHGQNGQHFDLTLRFVKEYAIAPTEALYLLVKTDPVAMPGNASKLTYDNKVNYKTDTTELINGNWPDSRTSQNIVGPNGDLNKTNGNVFVVKDSITTDSNLYTNSIKETYGRNAKFYRVDNDGNLILLDSVVDVAADGTKRQNNELPYSMITISNSVEEAKNTFIINNQESKNNYAPAGINDQFLNYRFSDGTYVTWLLEVNKAGATAGEYTILDQLPEGVELAFVRTYQVDGAGNSNTSGSYPYLTNSTTQKYNETAFNNIRVRATGENRDFETDGWQHRVVISNRNGQINWEDTLTDYYVKDNQIKILLPNVVLNNKIVFQIVCRVTDPTIYFTDVSFVNTATILDSRGNIVESDSSLVNVRSNNLQKTDLASYDGNKLTNVNIPYEIVLNEDGADMAEGLDFIPTALIDNMSSNLSIDLNSLRIYAVDAGTNLSNQVEDPAITTGAEDYYRQFDENGLPLYVSTNTYRVNGQTYYVPNYIKDADGNFIEDSTIKPILLPDEYYASGLGFDIPEKENINKGYKVYTTSTKNLSQNPENYGYYVKQEVSSANTSNLIYSGNTYKVTNTNQSGQTLYNLKYLKQIEIDEVNADNVSTGKTEYYYKTYNMYQEVNNQGQLLYYDESTNEVTTNETSKPVLNTSSKNPTGKDNVAYLTTESTSTWCFDLEGNRAYQKTDENGYRLYYTDINHTAESTTKSNWPVLTTDNTKPAIVTDNEISQYDAVYGNIAHNGNISGIRVAVEPNRNENGDLDGTTNIKFYGLPDGKKIYIRYNAKLNANSGTSNNYKNAVYWNGYEPPKNGETSKDNISYETTASAGTETHGAAKITKYDGTQTQTVLSGAEFTLYRAKYRLPAEGYLEWSDIEHTSQAELARRHPAVYLYIYDSNGEHQLDGFGGYMHEEMIVTRDPEGHIDSLRKKDGTPIPINTKGLHHDLDFDINGKPQVYTDEPLASKVTGLDGVVTYGLAQDEDSIHFNKVYAIVETKAPTGYEVDSTPHFFVVPNKKNSGNKDNYFFHEIESEYPNEISIVRTTASNSDTLTYNLSVFDYKATAKVTKLFGGNAGENIYKTGTYKFGIWNASDVIITGNKQNPIIEAKLDEVTISYTENDFGYYIGNSLQYTQYKNENGNWKSRDVKLSNGTEIIGEWSSLSGQVPVGVTYGILPNHEKTAIFQNLTFGKSYYVYELDSAGRPIPNNTSGVINGNTFVITYDGTGEVVNLLTPTKDADNNTITPVLNVTNNSYQVKLTKKLLNLAGGATQVTGNYYFGIWKANAEGEFDLTKSPIAIKGIQWHKNEVTSEKSLVFDNLQLGTYAIYEIASPTESTPIMQGGMLDANGNHFKVVYQDNNIVIIDDDTQESNVHIINNATVALPQSGGPGDLVFIVGGMALVLLGLLLSIKKQKRTNY